MSIEIEQTDCKRTFLKKGYDLKFKINEKEVNVRYEISDGAVGGSEMDFEIENKGILTEEEIEELEDLIYSTKLDLWGG